MPSGNETWTRSSAGRADDHERAPEARDAVFHVARRARIEQRTAGHAARPPVLDNGAARRDAELGLEALGRNLSQLILGEQRDLRPHLGIIQPVEIDALQTIAEERRTHRLRHRAPLASALDFRDVRRRAWPMQHDELRTETCRKTLKLCRHGLWHATRLGRPAELVGHRPLGLAGRVAGADWN